MMSLIIICFLTHTSRIFKHLYFKQITEIENFIDTRQRHHNNISVDAVGNFYCFDSISQCFVNEE